MSTEAAHPSQGPARNYSWPPFEPGNFAGERHGANSERRWRPLAAELVTDLAVQAPWVRRGAFAASVAAWARCEAQLRLIGDYLDRQGLLDGDGVPRPALAAQLRLESQAMNLRARLGLDPSALVRLLGAVRDQPGAIEEREALLSEARALVAGSESR